MQHNSDSFCSKIMGMREESVLSINLKFKIIYFYFLDKDNSTHHLCLIVATYDTENYFMSNHKWLKYHSCFKIMAMR